jgi:hypothetical protein
MNSNINKEILTEIRRISELMSINEQPDDIIKGIARAELAKVTRQQVSNSIKQMVKKQGYDAVETAVKRGDLVNMARLYKDIYGKLGRALTNPEQAALRVEIAKTIKAEGLNILKQEKNVLTKIAAKASTGVKNVVAKTKKLFGGSTKELKPTVAKTAQVESQMAKIGAKEQQELVEGVTKNGWSWARVKKWGVPLGIGALALWWHYHDSNAEAPSDIPADNSNVDGGSGGSSGTGGGKYTSCPETLPIKQFCKNETVKKVQACLKMPTRYQTGNFGPITQEYLESRGQDGTVITTETIIAVCGDSGVSATTGSTATTGTTTTDTTTTGAATTGVTGYEDYTTDEIETSVDEPTSPASEPAVEQ